jgi:HAE1 family hydrophobic/amphiphilic exporter-1
MIQLTRFSLKRVAVIVLATLLLSLLGGYSASRLNVDLLPDIEFPVVSIVTIYPGASPDDVNTGVTVPIEGVLSGTTGLQSLTSTSSEGVGVTVAQYDFGTDLDDVERTITNGLGALNLPQGVVAPQINRFNFNNFPVLTLGLLGEADPSELEALASGRIVPELRGLPGVARVDVTGGAQRQVRLTIDPQKLATSGVTLTQVTGALQGNNFILPAGTVVEGAQSIPVRAGTQFASVEEIKNLVVGVKGVAGASGAGGGPPAGVTGGATGGPPTGVAGGATAPPAAPGAPASAGTGAPQRHRGGRVDQRAERDDQPHQREAEHRHPDRQGAGGQHHRCGGWCQGEDRGVEGRGRPAAERRDRHGRGPVDRDQGVDHRADQGRAHRRALRGDRHLHLPA